MGWAMDAFRPDRFPCASLGFGGSPQSELRGSQGQPQIDVPRPAVSEPAPGYRPESLDVLFGKGRW